MDPPPPYSPTSEVHTPKRPVLQWHPKMTPNRVFVLSTTVALGTLKAIFTYRGESKISTTLEWIIGVVVSLLIFNLGEWESKENYPERLTWFFQFDCIDLIWRTLSLFSVPRPTYRSEEISPKTTTSPVPFTPVTGYRILVSSIVVILGTIKATLAYLGHDTSANTLDWTLSVLATSLLYYVGLYEYNSNNLAPTFFARDHSSPFFRCVRDVMIILMLGLACHGCIQWVMISLFAIKKSHHSLATTTSSTSGSFILDYSVNMFLLCATVLSLTLSLSGCLALLVGIYWALQNEVPQVADYLFQRSTFKVSYDRFVQKAIRIGTLTRSWAQGPLYYVKRIGYPIIRAITHVFVIVSLITLTFFFLGILVWSWHQNGPGATLFQKIPIQVLLGAYVLCLLVLLYYVFLSLISPFRSTARTFWHASSQFLRINKPSEPTQRQAQV